MLPKPHHMMPLPHDKLPSDVFLIGKIRKKMALVQFFPSAACAGHTADLQLHTPPAPAADRLGRRKQQERL